MESKFNFLKTAFDDFYGPGNTNIKDYKNTKYTGQITPTDQNVYVHDCVFQSCSSSSDGGAISCGNTVYKLLVEQTSFISCKTSSSNGGAIYFNSQTNGECILSRICGFDCSSTYSDSYGQFSNTYTKNDVAYKNYINDSSITRSSNWKKGSYETLRLQYGNILCPSTNLTNNMCYYYTALLCWLTKGTGSPVSVTFCISYSSIINNTNSGGYGVFYHDNSVTSHCIDTCNIINNKQNISSYGAIIASGNLFIKDSCILGNNENDKVFYVSSSSSKITISNCTIDDDIFTNGRYAGSVTIIKTITKTFINALSHISTHLCDSYFDSYGTLSAKPNVPSQISRCLLSCNCRYQTNDLLRYIQFIFLLTFLPSGTENGKYFHFNCLF
jgi:hypothetical protein